MWIYGLLIILTVGLLITLMIRDNEFDTSTLLIVSTIIVLMFIIVIGSNVMTEKNTTIDCLNGKYRYKKLYIMENSVVVDSVYKFKQEK